MDLPRAFLRCRPGAVFKINSVNFFSLETANQCYEGDDKVTDGELNIAWTEIQAEDKVTERIAEIDSRLEELDHLSIRSLRAKGNGRDNQSDRDVLIALDDEAVILRAGRSRFTIKRSGN